MVKVTGKNNKTAPPVSNYNSFLDHDAATALSTESNSNSSIDTANVIENDDIENKDYNKESSVWKYATKVGPEKARCNICQTGKHIEHTMQDYVLS